MLVISLTTSAHLTTLLAATEVYVCTSLALLNDDLIYIESLALKVFFKGMLDIRRVIVNYVKKNDVTWVTRKRFQPVGSHLIWHPNIIHHLCYRHVTVLVISKTAGKMLEVWK